jgi:hypothetical protein
MTRRFFALALASFSFVAVAAPPTVQPVDVNVTNTVPAVVVSNTDLLPVTDTDAAGRRPARFGPMTNFPGSPTQVVPAVTEGQVFSDIAAPHSNQQYPRRTAHVREMHTVHIRWSIDPHPGTYCIGSCRRGSKSAR